VKLFDAQLHAAALRQGDLEDLRFFGVAGALVPAADGAAAAPAVASAWDGLAGVIRRMERAGLAAWGAAGVHPRWIPRRGLEALLAELPEHLGRRRVAALGPVGLDGGGPREEEVLLRQLALARELRRPVLVWTPPGDRLRATRRVVALLREAGVEAGRALVVADAGTARLVRGCGQVAALLLTGRGLEDAVRLVRAQGPDGIALASGAGDGAGDLLALPRAAARLAKAGLSAAVIRRACGENARRALGI
jgi:predicted metal-dependent TIM-barrel fold hydrolase